MSGVSLIVCITEGVPTLDMIRVRVMLTRREHGLWAEIVRAPVP